MTSTASVLLVATTNRGKLAEIRGMLAGLPYEIVALTDVATVPEPDETGETFEDNAREKALYYAGASGLLTVAEDSGLEIDALDNAPGVHSARWHGTDYAVKFAKIRELLAVRGRDGSAARFVCAIAVARGDLVVYEATGTVHGVLAPEPRGINGFGYDPIFVYPPLNRTLAELDPVEKSGVSHRGQAFHGLRDHLLSHPDLLG